MSARATVLGLMVASLAVAGPAAAAPIPVPVGAAAALAGDRVITLLGQPPGPVRVVSRGLDGGSVTLATLTPPGHKRAGYYVQSLAASATTWAVALEAIEVPENDDEQPEHERGELIVSGSTAGGPARTLAACARNEEIADPTPIHVAVAGDDVAWSTSSCPGATGVRLAPAGGGPVTLVTADGFDVALTPARLAFYGVEAGHSFIEVRDRATGTAQRIPNDAGISAFTLGDTGIGAVIAPDDPKCSDGCRMSVMRLAADGTIERPGLAPTVASAPGPGSLPLVAGGGRVLAVRPHGNGLVAVDLATGTVSYAGALGLDFDGVTPLGVDATSAVYMAPRCDGTNEVRVEPTVPGLPARLSYVPCPVRVLSRTLTLRRGHHVGHLPIRCPRGCDAEWELRYRGRIIGSMAAIARAGVRTRTGVGIDDLRPLRHARRITATLGPDTYVPDHPRAKQQAPIRVVVRARG